MVDNGATEAAVRRRNGVLVRRAAAVSSRGVMVINRKKKQDRFPKRSTRKWQRRKEGVENNEAINDDENTKLTPKTNC